MAKNTRRGLGRGLNSLLGVYDPTSAPTRKAEETEHKAASHQQNDAAECESMPESASSSNIEPRFEDAWKNDGQAQHTSDESIGVAESFDSESDEALTAKTDGVTLKGVVERAARHEEPGFTEEQRGDADGAVVTPRHPIKSTFADDQKVLQGGLMEVPVAKVVPNPNQPRIHFKAEELEELSSSIEKDGLLQPILVREQGDVYQIIAGERRWQASKKAGLAAVPIRIVEADDDRALELALIENLQRSDLNPIEEAYGYKRMMERGRKTQSEVAAAVSKGRSTVANALRLLDLPESAQELLYEEKITAGHARAILSVPTEENRQKLITKIIDEKLSVRQTENIARLYAGKQKGLGIRQKPVTPPFFRTAARSLSSAFGTKVKVKSSRGKNKIEIEFKDEEDLKALLERVGK